MFQWVTHRHVRHQCSGRSAQVFPLKRCKDARLAGTAVHNVSLCCCGGAATSRGRPVVAQHAPSCLCLKPHASLTLEVDPVGQAGKWALLLVCDLSAQFCRSFPEDFQTPFSFLSSDSAPSIYLALTTYLSRTSGVSLWAKLTKLLMEGTESAPKPLVICCFFTTCDKLYPTGQPDGKIGLTQQIHFSEKVSIKTKQELFQGQILLTYLSV